MEIISSPIAQYLQAHSKGFDDQYPFAELMKKTHQMMSSPNMLSGPLEGRFLNLLVKIKKPQVVLELGTFTGYSALCMAQAFCHPEQKLYTFEVSDKHADFAQSYFDKVSYGKQIEIVRGKALENLKKFPRKIDMAFIDADKENYPAYYELIMQRICAEGIIVVDNALWGGDVLNPSAPSAKAIDRLNKTITKDSRVENILLGLRDGVHVLRVK